MMNDVIYDPETETIEELGRGGRKLIQPRRLFRYGTDSVLITDFAAGRAFTTCADLGSGSGVIAILLSARNPRARIDCIEIQHEMADVCARNIRFNSLEDRLRLFETDMRTAHKLTGCEKYDMAVSNPPYYDAAGALHSPNGILNTSRQDGECSCDDLCLSAFRLIKNGGRFCVIYPAARLTELLGAMTRSRLAPKRIRCVQDSPEHVCKLIMVEAVKNGGDGLIWLKPLYLHDENGNETDEYKRIYGMSE